MGIEIAVASQSPAAWDVVTEAAIRKMKYSILNLGSITLAQGKNGIELSEEEDEWVDKAPEETKRKIAREEVKG